MRVGGRRDEERMGVDMAAYRRHRAQSAYAHQAIKEKKNCSRGTTSGGVT